MTNKSKAKLCIVLLVLFIGIDAYLQMPINVWVTLIRVVVGFACGSTVVSLWMTPDIPVSQENEVNGS
jgi:hypothetical protein